MSLEMIRLNPSPLTPLYEAPTELVQSIYSFCNGNTLRSIELTNKGNRDFLRSDASRFIWYQATVGDSPNLSNLVWSNEVDYRQFYTLFVVRAFRAKVPSWMPKSCSAPYRYLKSLTCRKDRKCTNDNCFEEERNLYKTLLRASEGNAQAKTVFESMQRVFGTRGRYDKDGNPILLCIDCESDKPLSHGCRLDTRRTSCSERDS